MSKRQQPGRTTNDKSAQLAAGMPSEELRRKMWEWVPERILDHVVESASGQYDFYIRWAGKSSKFDNYQSDEEMQRTPLRTRLWREYMAKHVQPTYMEKLEASMAGAATKKGKTIQRPAKAKKPI